MSLPVVRRFVSKVEEAALGERVVKGVSPDQKLVKVCVCGGGGGGVGGGPASCLHVCQLVAAVPCAAVP